MRIVIALIITATLLLSGPAMAESPTQALSATVDQILALLRDQTLDKESKRRTLAATIEAGFDFDTMARSTLGRHWRKATPEQQKRFQQLFTDLLESTYLGRIEAYTNETVSYGAEKIRGNKALVETSVHSGNNDIPIHYKLVQKDGGWYVYDVVIEGVSLVRNFRSSYGAILDRKGFDELFARMEGKINELKKNRQS